MGFINIKMILKNKNKIFCLIFYNNIVISLNNCKYKLYYILILYKILFRKRNIFNTISIILTLNKSYINLKNL